MSKTKPPSPLVGVSSAGLYLSFISASCTTSSQGQQSAAAAKLDQLQEQQIGEVPAVATEGASPTPNQKLNIISPTERQERGG